MGDAMEKIIISDIANSIVNRRCALFAGSGLTAISGGVTWDGLVDFLKDKLGYSSPLKDNFRIIGDMYKKFGEETVYNAVQKRLRETKGNESISKLASFPWFTVFTTNYDTVLEESLKENQSLFVRTIDTGQEFPLAGLQSEILCVKLMGSLDIPYGAPGSMVLTPGDLAVAREERGRIFDILQSHAANLSFLFVGYSFEDGLFFEILEKLMKSIGSPKDTYYAVFKEPPDEEKSYLLKQYNVKSIISDLDSFVDELSGEVALRNPKDFTLKRIPIGPDIVAIDSTKVGGFLSVYNPVFLEDLNRDISPYDFFRGDTNSFKPFGFNWHFQRKEIKVVVDEVLKKKKSGTPPKIIVVEGNPGTGRTFVILAGVYKLIKENLSVAIKIPSYSVNKFPTSEEINQFLEEISKASKERGIGGPKRVIFWAEFPLDSNDISQFKKLSLGCKYPAILIFEDFESSQLIENTSKTDEQIRITVDDDLSEERKSELVQYILNTVHTHRLPAIDKIEAERVINEEKKFLPIMYRTLDPARRSINKIVMEEFGGISDSDAKTCISFCALSTSLDLETPVAILKKALSNCIKKPLSYPDTFEIATEKAKAFIKVSEDPRTNPLVSVYHQLIAKYIVEMIGEDKVNDCLLSIAETADLRSKVEADFVSNLFIGKGVNWRPGNFRPFTEEGLEKALIKLKQRQPARPILHHLARFYEKKIFLMKK